jgi:hypothetical protein
VTVVISPDTLSLAFPIFPMEMFDNTPASTS